jgi:hypothetical protein
MVAFLCLAAALKVWSLCDELPARAARWDFSIYYMSATLMREGLVPYTTQFGPIGKQLGLEAGDIHHATDPPTFLLLMEPFTLMPERTAFYLWAGLNAALFAAALALLLDGAAVLRGRSALALIALAVLYPPVYFHFILGQSKIPILFLLAAMIRLMDRHWEWAAGLCLAFAGLIRIFPLLLLLYLALQRRWRMLVWTLAGLAGGGLLTLALVGERNLVSFRDGMAFLTGNHWIGMSGNIALGSAISRLFWLIAGTDRGAGADLIRRIIAVAAELALLFATIRATVRFEPGDDPDWRALSMWIAASVLLSPTAWIHYMVLFLIPFAQIAAANRSQVSGRAEWMAILSYVLILPTMVFLQPVPLIYSHLGRSWAQWFSAAVIEQWFVSAVLLYLAAYWLALDGSHRRDEPDFGKSLDSEPQMVMERY